MLKLKAKLKIDDLLELPNIADELSDDDKRVIAEDVCQQFVRDRESRRKWEHLTKKVIKLANLEIEKKHTPFHNSSNMKIPLITVAAQQFAARTYPEIIRNGEVVHAAVVGDDPTNEKHMRARVIADHMNYQALVETSEFENNLDKLLHMYPLTGVAFYKTYFNPMKQLTTTELIPYDEIIINNDIKSLVDARRITHMLRMHKNDIVEYIRYGLFSKVDDKFLDIETINEEGREDHLVYEQHRYLDLDGDGYEEPYIVTVLEKTKDVLRILPRYTSDTIIRNTKEKLICIHPIHYFTDFHFIPNPDGSYYSIGFGHLLFGINHAANSLANQIIDAGRLANTPILFVDNLLKLKGGDLSAELGKMIKVNSAMNGKISDSVHRLDFAPPAPVLYQLLETMTNWGKEIASINDTNMGQAQVQNVSSSVAMSQLEQGTKLATGIQRRLFRSLKGLFDKMYYNNSVFLPPQAEFLVPGKNVPISKEDYKDNAIMIKPVADPNMASDEMRARIFQSLMQAAESPLIGPIMNPMGVGQIMCDVLKIDNVNQVLNPPAPKPPSPEEIQAQSDMIHKQDQMMIEKEKLRLQEKDATTRAYVAESEMAKNHEQANLFRAQAYAAAQQPVLEQRKQNMDLITQARQHEKDMEKEELKGEVAVKVAKAKPKSKKEAD